MKRNTLDVLLESRAARRGVVLVTDLASGEQQVFARSDETGTSTSPIETAVREARERDRSAVVAVDGRTLFVHLHNPPLRLVIVGAVHIAQMLVHMAPLVGLEVTLVDPRSAWTHQARFPTLDRSKVLDAWPAEALAELRPDNRTAIVTLTHDPKLDDPALRAALGTDAFYIGALGSRKTQAARLRRLREAGSSEADLTRIAGPVGLPIGAIGPGEIAVSILGEIIETLRLGPRARRAVDRERSSQADATRSRAEPRRDRLVADESRQTGSSPSLGKRDG